MFPYSLPELLSRVTCDVGILDVDQVHLSVPVASNRTVCTLRVSIILATFAFNFSVFKCRFSHLFYDNITFRHLLIIIICPDELNFDYMLLIRFVLSTGLTE